MKKIKRYNKSYANNITEEEISEIAEKILNQNNKKEGTSIGNFILKFKIILRKKEEKNVIMNLEKFMK